MTLYDKRRARNRFVKRPEILPARLGDGYGHVKFAGLPNHCYIRVAGRVDVAFNTATPYTNDLQVDVGRDELSTSEKPGIYKVIGTRSTTPAGMLSQVVSMTFESIARALEYMRPGGGTNPLWVQGMQVMPLRVGQYSGLTVQIQPGTVETAADTYVFIPFTTSNLTTHLPSTAGKAAFVLITIDDTGAIVATKGSEFTLADMTTPALMLANIPAAPAGTVKRLSAVRMYAGQAVCQEARVDSDFIDLRWAPFVTGSSATVIKTADYTATKYDSVIVCNKATAMTITLPAATASGHTFDIKSIGAGAVTIDPAGAETIDGNATQVIYQWESVNIHDYATGLWVIL